MNIAKLKSRVSIIWPPLVIGIGILALWEGAVVLFEIQEFLLPKPSSIWTELQNNWEILRHASWETGKMALGGLAIGIVAGVTFAFFATLFRFLNEGLTPLAVAVNATPIVALAPIFNAWFGVTGSVSNQLVVATVVFFPVFINTAKGLTEVHVNEIELMRSYAAGDWTILKEVRIPNALPFFANALRVVAPLSVIAAIVAEYFGGPQDRVGYVITSNAGLAKYDVAWAAIAVASAFGLSLFVGALLIERVSTPWKSAVQLEETTKR